MAVNMNLCEPGHKLLLACGAVATYKRDDGTGSLQHELVIQPPIEYTNAGGVRSTTDGYFVFTDGTLAAPCYGELAVVLNLSLIDVTSTLTITLE